MGRQGTTTARNAVVIRERAPVRLLQRECSCGQHTPGGGECEDCKKRKHVMFQRKGTAHAAPTAAPPAVIEAIRGPGRPLERESLEFFGGRFDRDLSGVRVHTGTVAADSARTVDALAYTVGNNIVFGHGQYAPHAEAGRRLLAHELAHTIQQGSAGAAGKQPLFVSSPGDSSEMEAERAADAVMQGEQTGILGAGGPRVARQSAQGHTPAPRHPAHHAHPSRPDQEGEVGIRGKTMGVYSTMLDRRPAKSGQPCRLTLTVMVHFTPQGPWPHGSFAKWQQDLIRVVTNRWSFRFMLAPTQACPGEPCRTSTAILRVVPTATTSSTVENVTVHYVKPKHARSNLNKLYESDIDRKGTDQRTGQVVATHEAGHWLGLTHIHCRSGADKCYGVTEEERADIMGVGEIVSARDYAPFADAMTRITHCPWNPVEHGKNQLFGTSLTGPLALFLGAAAGLAGGLLLGGPTLIGEVGVGLVFGGVGAIAGAGIGSELNKVTR